jgi:hypothetical protein
MDNKKIIHTVAMTMDKIHQSHETNILMDT